MKDPYARWLLLVTALLLGLPAHAAVRAWVNPERIQMGQSTTLSVETDQTVNQVPDLSALSANFNILGQSSRTNTSISGSRVVTQTTFVFELEPKEVGVLSIPSFNVAGEATEALNVTVLPAQAGSASNGDLIYLETQFDSTTPYVQQAVRYSVRLYYAVPLINGAVEAPAPANAALQTLGEERNFSQDIDGRTYQVFERNYLLLPERSGPLSIPPPVFRGRARNANVDPFFDRGQNVSVTGQGQTIEVRAQPAGSPDPWLAARSARFARAAVPQQGKVGEPLMLELTLDIDGVAASQLPALNLPDIPGAQVFPEAPQNSDQLAQGHIRAQLRRRFAIVPNTPGPLSIPELRVAYWNTSTDQLDAAVLPRLDLQIAAGASSSTAPATGMAPISSVPVGSVGDFKSTLPAAPLWPWQAAVALLSAALLAALAWGWSRGRNVVVQPATVPMQPLQQRLQSALKQGDLQQISLTLALLTGKPSPAQKRLIDELHAVLWSAEPSTGNHADLLERLRGAFKSPEKPGVAHAREVLPDLYPKRA